MITVPAGYEMMIVVYMNTEFGQTFLHLYIALPQQQHPRSSRENLPHLISFAPSRSDTRE